MDDICATLSIVMDRYEFGNWLMSQIESEGVSMSAFALRAGVSKQVISKYINNPPEKLDQDVLSGIARALRIAPEEVFRVAGLLPPARSSQRVDRLMYQIEELDEEDQATLETFVGALVERKRKKNTSTKPAQI